MEKVINYLLNNTEELKNVVRELNSWDGSFEDLAVHENDEDFFDTYFEGNPMEAVRAVSFGDYNYSDEYVRFNGYGNLETLDEYQLEDELKGSVEEIVDALIENAQHVSMDPELEKLLQEDDEEDDK